MCILSFVDWDVKQQNKQTNKTCYQIGILQTAFAYVELEVQNKLMYFFDLGVCVVQLNVFHTRKNVQHNSQ